MVCESFAWKRIKGEKEEEENGEGKEVEENEEDEKVEDKGEEEEVEEKGYEENDEGTERKKKWTITD